jgi:type II secretory pathway component PulF
MRRRYVAVVFAVVIVFAFTVPVIPRLDGVVNPLPCGTPPVTCVVTSRYLVSPTHFFFGIGGYVLEFWGNGTTSFQWHYGFDV